MAGPAKVTWARSAALALALMWCSQAFAAVEINTANEAELDSVRGFGPSSTARVLKAREDGPFHNWADLMLRVKGIRASTAAKLSAAGLTVNALPYPVTATEANTTAKP